MKTLILLVVGLILASVTALGDGLSWGSFKIINPKVKIMGSVGQSKLPDVKVPRKEVWVDMGDAYRYRSSQGTDLSVGIAPLPGNRQQVTVTQTVHANSQTTSQSPTPWVAPMVAGKAPQAAYVQRTFPLVPPIKRGK